MSSPTPSSDDRAASLLAQFQVEHASFLRSELDAWIDAHPELRDSPELRTQVLSLHALAERDRLSPNAARVGGSGSDPARQRGAFGRRSAERDPSGSAPLAGVTFVPGQRIGGFELRRFLAQGGMGQVWEAWDQDLRRRVALKLMLPEVVHTRGLELFAREARAGARLEHPNIVRTHAFGTDEGFTWIAQELVEGSWTLKDALDELRSSGALPEGYYRHVAQFAAQLADALAAAHEAGVIHRDIKPQNVLIAPDESPKLADFGLARVLDDSVLSRTGDFAGTYAYMSPEQVTAKRMGLDHRTDIFSLGVVLYELLTLHRPFDGDTAHQIAERIVAWDPPEAWRVRSQCPRELAIVCGKALEKLPSARYQTMTELAADLRRHLADEPILARPPSALMRVVKWSRRHPVISASAAVAGVAFAVVSWLYIENVRANESLRESNNTIEAKNTELAEATKTARENEQLAKKNAAAETEARREAEEKQALAARETVAARRARDAAEFEAYIANIAAAEAALRVNEIATVRRRLDACPEPLRNWEWRYLNATSDVSLVVLRGRRARLTSANFSPDDTHIVMTAEDGIARIFDSASGSALAVLRGHSGPVWCASFSPDGSRVATASKDNSARIWDTASGAELAVLCGHDDEVVCVAFSPDGTRVVTASEDSTARIWDASNGAEIATLQGLNGPLRFASFSPDGTRIVASPGGLTEPSVEDAVRIWLASTGQEIAVLRGHSQAIVSAAFSPDGKRVLTSGTDNTARIWDATTGRALVVLNGQIHDYNTILSAAYSPDGARIVTGFTVAVTASQTLRMRGEKSVTVWDAESGEEVAVLRGHALEIEDATFSPDGRQVATASLDNTARIWDATTGAELAVLRGHERAVFSVRYSHDGMRLVTASEDSTVRTWDVATRVGGVEHREQNNDSIACFGPDGSRVATGASVLDCATGKAIAILRAKGFDATSTAFSPDGAHIVTGSWDKTARIWDADTARETAVLRGHEDVVVSAAFSSDGSRVATSSRDQTARLWNATTGAQLTVLRGHTNNVNCVAFSPDGTCVATASSDSTVRLWNAASGIEQILLRGHGDSPVYSVAFNLRGTFLVTASADNTARLWDVSTKEERAVLRGHSEWVGSAAFNPDASRVVTGSGDKTIRIWDATTGKEMVVLRGHENWVKSVGFSPDGTQVISTSDDGTVRLWDSLPYRERFPVIQAARMALSRMRPLVEGKANTRMPLDSIVNSIQDHSSWSAVEQRGAAIALCELREKEYTATKAISDALLKEAERLNSSAYKIAAGSSAAADEVATALGMATSAVTMFPDNPDYRRTLGMTYFRASRFDDALSELRIAEASHRAANDERPADWMFLAMTYTALGRRNEATEAIERARRIAVEEDWQGNASVARFLAEAEVAFKAAFPSAR